MPSAVPFLPQQNESRQIEQQGQSAKAVPDLQNDKGLQPRSWAQVAQGPEKNNTRLAREWFQPQVAAVKSPTVSYPKTHLLGIPQEIRDAILEMLRPIEEVAGTRPKSGYENYQPVCRQIFHETSKMWSYQPAVLVPSNRSGEFVNRTLDITVLNSNAYNNVKSLFCEIHHDAPGIFFGQMAQVLRLSVQLEELHLFGIGPDKFGVNTSSTSHGCGKHDLSIVGVKKPLHVDGQEYQRRLKLFNSIPWLENLKVLVLDNINMPLLQAHVLKNKPKLEKLYVTADPRTVLHMQYRNTRELGLGCLVWPVDRDMPPVKELRVDSNAIFTASQLTAKVSSTLEVLEWVVADVLFQTHIRRIGFFSEAAILLSRLHLEARRLRELRICVHGPMSEDNSQYGNFMGYLKDCVSRMRSLQLVELHVHSLSPWFANEFVEALSPSVTRLYLTDLVCKRDAQQLYGSISTKTGITENPVINSANAIQICDDLGRKDYIPFSHSKLGFVGYEYDLDLLAPTTDKQERDMMALLKLNARLLDREHNRHLETLAGKSIPPKEGAVKELLDDAVSASDDIRSAATSVEVEENLKELAECNLGDDNEYFGNEDVAEVVFHHEPVATGGHYSYPVIVEVEEQFKLCNHWLSK